jgi:low affinity Fe/Cu permease
LFVFLTCVFLFQQAKFNVEVSAVREQFEEAERRCRSAEMDMAGLREKLEKARLDSLQVKLVLLHVTVISIFL